MPPEQPRPAATSPVAPIASSAPSPSSPADAPSENKPANPLTPEEQMALYEKELKETDWGHQPC